jgi:hypothetical protein
MNREANGSLRVEIGGQLKPPSGGFVIRPPGNGRIKVLEVNGKSVSTFHDFDAIIQEFPACAVVTFKR